MSNTTITATVKKPVGSFNVTVGPAKTQVIVPTPSPRQVNVTVEARDGILVPPVNAPITVTSWTGTAATYTLLADLEDVVKTTSVPETGMTLVYNEQNHKYEIKHIDIDGGAF